MSDLLEAIHAFAQNGLSWATLLTVLLYISKLREARIRRKERAEMRQDIKAIKVKLGVDECPSNGQASGSLQMEVQRLKRQCSLLRQAINRAKALRRKPMKNFLTSSSFRRWLSFIIATVIPIVNQRFGWNLDANEVIGIILLAAAHILGEAHFDGKKAVNAATSAINSALQASTVANPGSPIPQVTAPPMTYQEMLPYIQSVHKAVNGAYAAVQSGKFTDATQDAADFYMAVHGYLQALQSDQSKGA